MSIKLFIISLISGAVTGGITGYIGGVLGGGISGYFDPLTRLGELDAATRFNFAKVGASSAKIMGAIAGLIVGAIVSVLGDTLPIFALCLIAGVLFWFVSGWIVRGAGESIAGLPGGIVGGAIFGVIGGKAAGIIAKNNIGDILLELLPFVFIFGASSIILLLRDRKVKKFEAYSTDLTNFYLSPSPQNFDTVQLKADKFKRRLKKTKTNADLMVSVMIARIAEKYSWPIYHNSNIGRTAQEILDGQSQLAEYIVDDGQVDLLKLDLWWASYFATGDVIYLNKLLVYAGEDVHEGDIDGMLITAATWSFTVNCNNHDLVREYASKCLANSKYQNKKEYLEACINQQAEPPG